MISFSQPLLLLLVIPAWLALRKYAPGRGSRWGLHMGMLCVLVFIAADPVSEVISRGQTVVLLMDRSRSMPASAKQIEATLRQQVLSEQGPDDEIIVVGFGADSIVELAPNRPPPLGGAGPDPDETNLHAAVMKAVESIPSARSGRVIVVSDGLANDESSDELLTRLGTRRVPVHFVLPPTHVRSAQDVELRSVLYATDAVTAGMPLDFDLEIRAAEPEQRKLTVTRNRVEVGSMPLQLEAGPNRIRWTDRPPPGASRYSFEIDPVGDALPGDNAWHVWVEARGPRAILAVNPGGSETEWAKLLRGAGLEVHVADESALSLDRLISYDACLLENVSFTESSRASAAAVAAYVEQLGGGLLVSARGGAPAGPSVFRFNPLERLLPVAVRPLTIAERPPHALVVLVDPTAWEGVDFDPDLKLSPLQESLVTLAQDLDPADRLAIVAPRFLDPVIVPFSGNTRMRDVHAAVSQLGLDHDPAGFPRALEVAWDLLGRAPHPNKHLMLLISGDQVNDWLDPQLGPLRNPIPGSSVTVVTWGTANQIGARVSRLSAQRWRSASDVKALGTVLRQDWEETIGGSYTARPTRIRRPPGADSADGPLPMVPGYYTARLQSGATRVFEAEGVAGQPLGARWPRGAGRVVALLFEVAPPSEESPEWARLRPLLADLMRWAGRFDETRSALQPVLERTGRTVTVSFERAMLPHDPDAGLLELYLVRGDDRPVPPAAPFRADGDRLIASSELTHAGDYFSVVRRGELVLARGTPVCLPRSPEFLRGTDATDGREVLERLAQASHGQELVRGEPILGTPEVRLVSRVSWLAWVLAVLIVVDVSDRRFGLAQQLDGAWRRRAARRTAQEDPAVANSGTDPFEEAKERLRRRLRR